MKDTPNGLSRGSIPRRGLLTQVCQYIKKRR